MTRPVTVVTVLSHWELFETPTQPGVLPVCLPVIKLWLYVTTDETEVYKDFIKHLFCVSVLVVRNPPGWEVGIYLVGFFVLLGLAGLNIWKLWKSGTFPTPSPFPNFDYRYLQEKYGTSFSEVRQKVPVQYQKLEKIPADSRRLQVRIWFFEISYITEHKKCWMSVSITGTFCSDY